MAITKLTAQTTAQDMTPLLDILQEHAVPAYFDSVELVEGDTNQSISCKVGGTEFLRIWADILGTGTATNYGFTITHPDASTTQLYAGYGSAGYTGSVYVCSNALLLVPNSQTNNGVVICKDTGGATALALYTTGKSSQRHNGSQGMSYSESNYGLWAISSEDETPAPYNVYFNNADSVTGRTALCPIYTQTGSLQNVWQPLQRQFSEVSAPFETEMDGKRYLCTRGFVILDA
ncbi:MAG: hypothetical protein E7511_03005 [Ruminococcus sp.]|nr:hypothetical protein [Ruminococcus sp.]